MGVMAKAKQETAYCYALNGCVRMHGLMREDRREPVLYSTL
jgi:hypothetical protein